MRLLLLQKITLAFFFATKCDKHLTRLVALFLSYKPRHYAIFSLEKKNCDNCDNVFHGRGTSDFQILPLCQKTFILTIWCIIDFRVRGKKWKTLNVMPREWLSHLSQKLFLSPRIASWRHSLVRQTCDNKKKLVAKVFEWNCYEHWDDCTKKSHGWCRD